jgi:hypothetical protein
MIPIQDKLSKFSQYLHEVSAKMTFGQKEATKKMLEDLVNAINEREAYIDTLNARLAKRENSTEYNTDLDRAISILLCCGFTEVEVLTMKKEDTDFLIKHMKQLTEKSKMTQDRFRNSIILLNYFRHTENRPPVSLDELNAAFKEYRKLKQDFDNEELRK